MKILDIAFKDLTRSFRSAFAVGMMIIAPLALIGMIYFAFGGAGNGAAELPDLTVGIINADQLPPDAPLSRPLGDEIRSIFFDESVSAWIVAREYADAPSIQAALDQQEIDVAVLIPADFTGRFLAGESVSPMRILSDPTLTIAPQVARNLVMAMLDGASGGGIALQTLSEQQQANDRPSDPAQASVLMAHYSAWYTDFQRDMFHDSERAALLMTAPAAEGGTADPMQKMLGIMMAGQMVFFAFFTGAFSMMSILREDEEGTLARLFTTPVRRSAILAGKFLAVFLSLIVQGVVLLVAAHFAFNIHWGDPLAVALALTGQVIGATGLGVLLISFVKNTKQGGPVLGGGLTALGMLGGLFTANFSMPAGFARLAIFTPQGWVIKGWDLVLSGQPVSALLIPVAVMVIMGIVMFTIGAMVFRRRFA